MVAGGACMVAGGHAWLQEGGVHGCGGVCVVAGGRAWLYRGGMRGCSRAGGRYASYWNAFLFTTIIFVTPEFYLSYVKIHPCFSHFTMAMYLFLGYLYLPVCLPICLSVSLVHFTPRSPVHKYEYTGTMK